MTAEIEEKRLAALHETRLLDTERETEYDDLVSLAAQICETPISLFSLVDSDRQWFKARLGLEMRETPRNVSFCSHAIQGTALFEVEDASLDHRFRENALVTGDPNIRFYAGVPVAGPGGAMLGTLCVIDRVPRRLTRTQRTGLATLAAQVKARIDLRIQRRALREVLKAKEVMAAELHAKEKRFRTFMNNAPFVSFIKDAEGRFMFYNRRLAERFGVSSSRWLGKGDFDIWPENLAREFRKTDLTVMESGKTLEVMEETSDSLGTPATWKSYKFSWANERGEPMLGCIAVDVTEDMQRQRALEIANAKLERLATVDTLTGLANRLMLNDRLEYEFRQARRHQRALSVLLLDVDNFKTINDRLGHAVGDSILRRIGRVLRGLMRTTDMGARYGGEEFVVLLPGTAPEGAVQFAERLREALRREVWPKNPVTASIGVATIEEGAESGMRMLSQADDAMYAAKRAGKDCVEMYRGTQAAKHEGGAVVPVRPERSGAVYVPAADDKPV